MGARICGIVLAGERNNKKKKYVIGMDESLHEPLLPVVCFEPISNNFGDIFDIQWLNNGYVIICCELVILILNLNACKEYAGESPVDGNVRCKELTSALEDIQTIRNRTNLGIELSHAAPFPSMFEPILDDIDARKASDKIAINNIDYAKKYFSSCTPIHYITEDGSSDRIHFLSGCRDSLVRSYSAALGPLKNNSHCGIVLNDLLIQTAQEIPTFLVNPGASISCDSIPVPRIDIDSVENFWSTLRSGKASIATRIISQRRAIGAAYNTVQSIIKDIRKGPLTDLGTLIAADIVYFGKSLLRNIPMDIPASISVSSPTPLISYSLSIVSFGNFLTLFWTYIDHDGPIFVPFVSLQNPVDGKSGGINNALQVLPPTLKSSSPTDRTYSLIIATGTTFGGVNVWELDFSVSILTKEGVHKAKRKYGGASELTNAIKENIWFPKASLTVSSYVLSYGDPTTAVVDQLMPLHHLALIPLNSSQETQSDSPSILVLTGSGTQLNSILASKKASVVSRMQVYGSDEDLLEIITGRSTGAIDETLSSLMFQDSIVHINVVGDSSDGCLLTVALQNSFHYQFLLTHKSYNEGERAYQITHVFPLVCASEGGGKNEDREEKEEEEEEEGLSYHSVFDLGVRWASIIGLCDFINPVHHKHHITAIMDTISKQIKRKKHKQRVLPFLCSTTSSTGLMQLGIHVGARGSIVSLRTNPIKGLPLLALLSTLSHSLVPSFDFSFHSYDLTEIRSSIWGARTYATPATANVRMQTLYPWQTESTDTSLNLNEMTQQLLSSLKNASTTLLWDKAFRSTPALQDSHRWQMNLWSLLRLFFSAHDEKISHTDFLHNISTLCLLAYPFFSFGKIKLMVQIWCKILLQHDSNKESGFIERKDLVKNRSRVTWMVLFLCVLLEIEGISGSLGGLVLEKSNAHYDDYCKEMMDDRYLMTGNLYLLQHYWKRFFVLVDKMLVDREQDEEGEKKATRESSTKATKDRRSGKGGEKEDGEEDLKKKEREHRNHKETLRRLLCSILTLLSTMYSSAGLFSSSLHEVVAAKLKEETNNDAKNFFTQLLFDSPSDEEHTVPSIHPHSDTFLLQSMLQGYRSYNQLDEGLEVMDLDMCECDATLTRSSIYSYQYCERNHKSPIDPVLLTILGESEESRSHVCLLCYRVQEYSTKDSIGKAKTGTSANRGCFFCGNSLQVVM